MRGENRNAQRILMQERDLLEHRGLDERIILRGILNEEGCWYTSVGIATRCGQTGRGSNPGGGEIFSTCQTVPGAHPTSYTMGTGSFPGVNRTGRGVDNPHHLSSKLKKEQSCTSTPPLGLRGLFQGELYLTLTLTYLTEEDGWT